MIDIVSKSKEVIFLSDVHFGVKNASIEWQENICGYFNDFFIPIVKSEIEQGKSPCVIIAGDYFESRANIDISVLNSAMDIMDKLAEMCCVYLLVGNHDIYKNNDTAISSLRVFKGHKNVEVISELTNLTVGNKKFLLVPWIGNYSVENDIINQFKDTCDFMVFHTEISGMTYDNDRPIVNGMNISVLDDKCRILSGHIHKRQESKKAMYFGSPYATSRSDIGNEKGVYIFECKGKGATRRFIPNEYSPKFIRLNFCDYGKDVQNWGIIKNNYVDIVFTESEVNNFNANKFIEELRVHSPRNIEMFIRKEEKTADTISDDSIYNSDATIETMFNNSVKDIELKPSQYKEIEKLNKDYLARAAKELGL